MNAESLPIPPYLLVREQEMNTGTSRGAIAIINNKKGVLMVGIRAHYVTKDTYGDQGLESSALGRGHAAHMAGKCVERLAVEPMLART